MYRVTKIIKYNSVLISLSWKPHRLVMIEMLPQLITIDSKPITPIERIEAGQKFEEILDEMEEEIERLEIEGNYLCPSIIY